MAAEPGDAVRREALHRVLRRIEGELGPLGGDIRPIDGTAPGVRMVAHVAGVGPVFVKAGDGSPEAGEAVGAEVALLMTLEHRSLPTVLAGDPTDEIPWMVQARLSDAGWTPPWPKRMKPVWAAVAALSALPPPPWLPEVADIDPWQGLITTEDTRGHHDALQEAASRVSIAGHSLVHGDLGSGNVHAEGRRVTVVDWSDAFVGNADVDRLSIAVDLAHTDGRREVPPVDDVGGWLAKTAGLLLAAAARPAWPGPGGATVRATQASLARTALDWAIDEL
ncbi:phosphotransferase [Euzebya rosea]|uniref:phosphotransferase n=1 Tax=Euzebya rosea TaxID=2052804 RepID=UPI000D3E16D4|nr:phosphotransferase [Euzebya rosea]